MIATKRYDYVPFESIQVHPLIANHRALNQEKVAHYKTDIMKNGLLEPLIVWERQHGEYFLVGGFHRCAAVNAIRDENPGYFDRIDVRVVSGDLDEMRALNLKLNADRLDAKLTDYFDSIIYLNNANWSKEQIAEFLDKSESLVDDILRFAPSMDSRLRKMLEEGRISWTKCKAICRDALSAPAGQEREIIDRAIHSLENPEQHKPTRRPITIRTAIKRLATHVDRHPKTQYTVSNEDILALVVLLKGRDYNDGHIDRVRQTFPGLLED
ncbi:MAG: chromosome partitioning protein ParB [Spartobacteria bacterium]|nr:chromosome partitioning protein ParB [Spartobacteria bacterium]